MQATVKWVDGVMFVGESGSGHAVVMDGAPEHGGRDLGVRPMEMVLLGLGGCTSFDVIDILRKSRQPVTDCTVELSATRVDAVPATFERIHIHFRVFGDNLKASAVARAVELSATKYCSVSKMLAAGGVTVTHDHSVHEAAEAR